MNEESILIPEELADEIDIVEEAPAEEYDIPVEDEAPEESIDSLKEQIIFLKEQISQLEVAKDTQARVFKELGDFRDLFPEIELDAIPESVWESVKKGTPLIASYALYERQMEVERARIAMINAANASKSPGIAGKHTASEYFSPDEVRKMSRAEVHANYSKIRESMKKWI